MVCKCPNCDAALQYNPAMKKMECVFCGSTFEMEMFQQSNDTEKRKMADISDSTQNLQKKMEYNIYTCTTCGAQLMVNEVESSTFCSYCGQPTIVFDRVSDEVQPEYIIPFQITKEKAIEIIRQKLNKGMFVPKEVKHFTIDKIRGIYVPFWLYDIYYYDNQYLKGTVGSGKSKSTHYYIREGETVFEKLTVDASVNLDDELSQRLEPYIMTELETFDPHFMSGFYADRFDEHKEKLLKTAVSRANEFFNKKVEQSISASSIKIISNKPIVKVRGEYYALLPVWFLTFRYKKDVYTMLVNGQTGKLVGAVPIDKVKTGVIAAVMFLVFSIICSLISFFIFSSEWEDRFEGLPFLLFFGTIVLLVSITMFRSVWKNVERTKKKETVRFVRNRQDKI